jgi:hypothetical protein
MFGELVLGMGEIVEEHELKEEAVWDIVGLLTDLFEAFLWRQCRNDQRSLHAMVRKFVLGMCEIIDTHDLDDLTASYVVVVIDLLLETDLMFCHVRQASVQGLLDDLFAIYRGDFDEEPLSSRELLDDLRSMHFEHRRQRRKPWRRDPHPAMVELVARLDRYGSDHEKSQRKPAPAAG